MLFPVRREKGNVNARPQVTGRGGKRTPRGGGGGGVGTWQGGLRGCMTKTTEKPRFARFKKGALRAGKVRFTHLPMGRPFAPRAKVHFLRFFSAKSCEGGGRF